MGTISKSISNFFTHRNADFRMLLRAFASMGNGTTPDQIEWRVRVINRFRIIVENPANDQHNLQRIHRKFLRLDPSVRNLFYYLDSEYTQRLSYTDDMSEIREIKEEIIRECDQAISYQRTLTSVNNFYAMFSNITDELSVTVVEEIPTTSMGLIPTTDQVDLLSRVNRWINPNRRDRPLRATSTYDGVPWGYPLRQEGYESARARWDRQEGRFDRNPISVGRRDYSMTLSRPGLSEAVNLNIPGTVPFDQAHIPRDVVAKAAEIDRLKIQFDNLGAGAPVWPQAYNCPIGLDIMTIPVFDASHPSVQNALRASLTPGGTSTALNNRATRHHLEFDAMTDQINSGRHRCSICNHQPLRQAPLYLRIDTALQDEILQFLRASVGSASSTTRV